nr:phospholipase A(1) DAD1, chloroplastic-like [Tanacetum cinerariifolium]
VKRDGNNPGEKHLKSLMKMTNNEDTGTHEVDRQHDEVRARFENTLYGYFLGRKVAFLIVKKFERALEHGPCLIRKALFILRKWSPNGLSAIATRLGTPIMLDSCTTTTYCLMESVRDPLVSKHGTGGRRCGLLPRRLEDGKHILGNLKESDDDDVENGYNETATSVASKFASCRKRQLSVRSSWNSDSGQARVASRVAKLGQKWREYQGIKNWEGLLDPLDDGLRHEILRYGDFVEAAYRSFEFDSSSPDYGTCKYSKESMLDRCGLGDCGYKVTKNLHATCGVQLPSWTSTNSSWIGYVAVCNDEEEIARLGRRDVVIAFRGTATCLEWIENLRAMLTSMPHDVTPEKKRAMVQQGFLSMYTSATPETPSLRDMVREEISRIVETYGNEPLSVTITGHSLGAALAKLTAYDITYTCKHSPMVTVVSFGGPRVGNRNFRSQLEKSGTRVLRIVNSTDVITKVPGLLVDDSNDMTKRRIQVPGLPQWLQKRVDESEWFRYADVGKELRLSSDASPYLTKNDFATCHDLKTYLHLVDGFVSSTCPFRTTAKRLLSGTKHEKQQILVR